MSTHIALLRGINVGGRNKLPMEELRAELEALGLEDVRTYIQSGNVVFRTAEPIDPEELAEGIAGRIEARRGFRPRVLVLPAGELAAAMEANPFPEAEEEPRRLHLWFLAAEPAAPDLDGLAERATASERFRLAGCVFYLHAPDGIGRSKLAASVERLLGVEATARNWRTVVKLGEMVG